MPKQKKYQKIYGFEIGTGEHDTWNNEADAFKHAYMQAIAQFDFGSVTSNIGGYYHEFEGLLKNQSKEEANMDLWNNEIGREIGRNIKKFVMGKRKSEYPKEKIEDMIAEEIVKRMKNGELITNPKDNRSYINKKLGVYEINKLRKQFKTFTGYASDIQDNIPTNKIFTAEEIGNLSTNDFIKFEKYIDNQLENYGIPRNFEAEEKVKSGDLIWVNSYIRDDGTEVKGYYRCKPGF
ncbi:hypothetical protein IJ818_01355 [bacterium]|nr:hypothetical protein [bacterium]